jgi:hypothetical protein
MSARAVRLTEKFGSSGTFFSTEKLVPGHFAERHFAERHFAERTFCRRTFCRTDILPKGQLAENRDGISSKCLGL